ncbi:hypothetical protein JCM8547_005086 [Rhodosporidiobolus lusitaniae]
MSSQFHRNLQLSNLALVLEHRAVVVAQEAVLASLPDEANVLKDIKAQTELVDAASKRYAAARREQQIEFARNTRRLQDIALRTTDTGRATSKLLTALSASDELGVLEHMAFERDSRAELRPVLILPEHVRDNMPDTPEGLVALEVFRGHFDECDVSPEKIASAETDYQAAVDAVDGDQITFHFISMWRPITNLLMPDHDYWPVQKPTSADETEKWRKSFSKEVYIAKIAYKSQEEDEHDVELGDRIMVDQVFKDGWVLCYKLVEDKTSYAAYLPQVCFDEVPEPDSVSTIPPRRESQKFPPSDIHDYPFPPVIDSTARFRRFRQLHSQLMKCIIAQQIMCMLECRNEARESTSRTNRLGDEHVNAVEHQHQVLTKATTTAEERREARSKLDKAQSKLEEHLLMLIVLSRGA